VAVAEHVVDRPSFDEYVVARGGDLLRTAWLLVGEDRAAQELVRTALARAWPQWSHLAGRGAGSYDTDLRRFLVHSHLTRRHHLHRPRQAKDRVGSAAGGRDPGSGLAGGRPFDALDALSPVERAVLVLLLFDGLGEGQVADLLDDDVGSVRRHRLHGLALVRDRFGLDEREVRGLLESLAPDDPPVEVLLSGRVGYAPRWRGLRGWLFAVAALAVAALVVSLVPGQLRDDGEPSPRPTPSLVPDALSCRASPGPPAPPRPVEPPLSARYVAVLVCARTDDGSVWSGALPPDDPVTDPAALDSLALAPRGSGAPCGDLPNGPAYRLLLLGRDGTTTTWANEGLACDGWPALAQVYVATAEQDARTRVADDGFLGCPTALGQQPDPTGAGAGLRKGTVLVEATACLHPLAEDRPRAIPRYRAVRGNVLGTPSLAELNTELARSGSRRAVSGDCARGPWRYVIRARTDGGRLVDLSSICGREFAVDGHARDLWPVSADTTGMLRALLIAN
jgi:DNA-directed RNA polymerase specialized sigma24 family protein